MKGKKKGMELEKEEKKKMKMSCDNNDEDDDDDFCPPYKVSFPGEYDPYELGPLTDPRLGIAQKLKDNFYKEHGFSDDDDDDDLGCSEDDESKDKTEDKTGDEDGADEDEDEDEDGDDEDESESDSEDESSELPIRVIQFSILSSKPNSDLPIKSTPPSTNMPNNYKRHWKKYFKRLVQNEAKYLMRRDCDCAEAAINFYNQKHGTDYEIVETLGSYRRIYLGFWFHCNFRAKCKSDPSSPPKLFFAELQTRKLPNLIVQTCVPLDHPQKSSSVVRGCPMCGNQLLHPVDGFEAGRTYRSWYTSRTRPRIFF